MVHWDVAMAGLKFALVAVCAVASIGASAQTPASPSSKPALKDCEDLHIRYVPMDPKLAARMVIEPTSDSQSRGTGKQSPQGTRWMLAPSPDYGKAGPWTTTIFVGGEDQPTIKLTLRDHEGFTIEWLNEKLLYGTIAWSKSLSTDFIVDVEAQKFIYREMENSSDLGQECE